MATTFAAALKDATMLATLTTSTWGIHRTQRDLSDTVATETNGNSRAFAVRKNLLAGADTHQRNLVAIIASFRSYLYRKTLPFASSGSMVDRGPRIMANSEFFDLNEKLGDANARIREALDQFERDYDEAIETAKANLGSAFDPADYPDSFDTVRDSFRIDVEFQPLPSKGGFGSSLSDAITMRLDDEIDERLQTKAKSAVADIRERAKELATRYRDRLDAAAAHDEDGPARRPRITTSLFEAATELAATIRIFSPLMMLDDSLGEMAGTLAYLGRYTQDDLYEQPFSVGRTLDDLDALLR